MMAQNDSIPKKTENLMEKDIENEIVVMSPEGKVLHTFEGSASFIWKMIDGVHTIEFILTRVTEEYQVQPAIARSDLETFIKELRRLSLIQFE